MIGEFRLRDAILAAYYLAFATANWLLVRVLGPMEGSTIAAMLGVTASAPVLLIQNLRVPAGRFNTLGFRAFIVLMMSFVAADILIACRAL